MEFDLLNRLLISDNDSNNVLVSTGGTPQVLFSLPDSARDIAVSPTGQIFAAAADGVIRIYDEAGNLVDNGFITGLAGGRNAFAFGRGGVFGNDLYSVDDGRLLRVDSSGNSSVLGTGLPLQIEDIAFSPDGSALFLSDFSNDRILRISQVPEPTSLTLLGIGAVSLIGYGWRRKRILTA